MNALPFKRHILEAVYFSTRATDLGLEVVNFELDVLNCLKNLIFSTESSNHVYFFVAVKGFKGTASFRSVVKRKPLKRLYIKALNTVAYRQRVLAVGLGSTDKDDVGRIEGHKTGHWRTSWKALFAVCSDVNRLNMEFSLSKVCEFELVEGVLLELSFVIFIFLP